MFDFDPQDHNRHVLRYELHMHRERLIAEARAKYDQWSRVELVDKVLELTELSEVQEAIIESVEGTADSFRDIAMMIGDLSKKTIDEAPKKARSETGRLGAEGKKANDPKAHAKKLAFALWQEVEAGLHPKLVGNERFAIEVVRRWPILKSVKNVATWPTAWRRQSKGADPAC